MQYYDDEALRVYLDSTYGLITFITMLKYELHLVVCL